MKITFTLNHEKVDLNIDPMRRLADILRIDLGVLDVKVGCGEGECGSCTVLLNDEPVPSCLVNAVRVHGGSVLTAAGIAATDSGKLLVDCFAETGAVQCGFCFPGVLVVSFHYLRTDGRLSLDRIKNSLSGNLCRCTGYKKIIESIGLACKRKDHVVAPAATAKAVTASTATAKAVTALTKSAPIRPRIDRNALRENHQPVRFYQPRDIGELLHLCETVKGKKYFLAGGTDINIQLQQGIDLEGSLLFIRHLPDLRSIQDAGDEIRIGGSVSFGDILSSSLLRKYFPFFCRSLEQFGAPGIRNLATLAGNLANGSPTADSAPLLLVLAARLELVIKNSKRIVPVEDFYTGYKQNVLTSGELISAVILRKNAEKGCITFYRKIGARRAQSIAKISLAAITRVKQNHILEARLAVGSLNEFPRRLRQTEELLLEYELVGDDEIQAKIRRQASTEITPITDFRSDAQYRETVCLNLIEDYLNEVFSHLAKPP